MAKLIWRVKVVADLGSGGVSETEVARIERDDFAVAETVGLTLDEEHCLDDHLRQIFLENRFAAFTSRRLWTRMSSTTPS